MRRIFALTLAAALAGAVGAASSGADTSATAPCSASKLTAPLRNQRLPAAVASMRSRIFRAASRCDYATLTRLGNERGKGLEFSFGAGPTAAAYWRRLERGGEPVMRYLVKVLNLPLTHNRGSYSWPSANRPQATDADWQALRALYPQSVIDKMRRDGIGYSGYRVGISPNGDWQYFVTGD